MTLDFFYDVVCPYAYLGSVQVEALARRTGATLRWRPTLLGGLFRHVEAPQNPGALMNPNKARLNLLDMQRQAERLGVELTMPAAHPRRSVEAMRLLTACPDAARPALSHALYRAYWVQGRDISDRAVLGEIAAEHGLGVAAIDDPAVKQALFDTTAQAAGHGAFGVPALVIDGQRLYWGADRLHFVEAALGGP
ncbi:MAG: 2-hydroxychromene-2-carboxylate isomerase, partial [Myxococcales bacterium]|nr:2-hydroxychromene-2-carboxylate isomerase [Myxococcales bacterium]